VAFDGTTPYDVCSDEGYFADMSAFDIDPLTCVKELSTSPSNFWWHEQCLDETLPCHEFNV